MGIDREVIEVVLGPADRLIGVYALDDEGNRAVNLGPAITDVNQHYDPSGPGRTQIDALSYRVVTTREVNFTS